MLFIFEQVLLAIVQTNGGWQSWEFAYEIRDIGVVEHLARRLEETRGRVSSRDELMPHLMLE